VAHSHVTEKGHNVECPECAAARRAAALPDVNDHPAVARLAALDAIIDQLLDT
jgi:hypothetical protein